MDSVTKYFYCCEISVYRPKSVAVAPIPGYLKDIEFGSLDEIIWFETVQRDRYALLEREMAFRTRIVLQVCAFLFFIVVT